MMKKSHKDVEVMDFDIYTTFKNYYIKPTDDDEEEEMDLDYLGLSSHS